MSDLSRTELRDLARTATQIVRDESALHDDPSSERAYTGEYVTALQVRAVVEALGDAGYLVMLKRDARLMYGVETDGVGEHVHFESVTPKGRPMGILGNPNMPPDTLKALGEMMDAVAERYGPPPPTGDDGEHGFMGGGLPTPDDLDAWGNPRETQPEKPEPEGSRPAPSDVEHTIKGVEFTPFPTIVVETKPLPEPEPPPAPAAPSPHPDGWSPKTQADYRAAVALLQRIARDGIMPSVAEYNDARGGLPQAMTLLARLGLKWSEIAARIGLTPVLPGGRGGRGRQSAANDAEANRPAAPTPPEQPASTPTAAPQVEPAPILHRAPDGGVTKIIRNADGRQVRMLRAFEDK